MTIFISLLPQASPFVIPFLKMWKKCFIAAIPSMAMPCSAVSIAATLGLFPSDAKAVFVLLAAIFIPFAVLLLCLLS